MHCCLAGTTAEKGTAGLVVEVSAADPSHPATDHHLPGGDSRKGTTTGASRWRLPGHRSPPAPGALAIEAAGVVATGAEYLDGVDPTVAEVVEAGDPRQRREQSHAALAS